MGGKGSTDNAAGDAQARLATQLFGETDPLRKGLIQHSSGLVNSITPTNPMGDITSSPDYLAAKSAADLNFNRAKDNTLATTAPGGGLSSALANLEQTRAATLTQGAGQAYNNELGRALTLSTGAQSTASAAGGSAAMAGAQTAALNAQSNAAKTQGAGEAVGTAAGSYAAKSAAPAAAAALCDVRCKEDIKKVGHLDSGEGVYTFKYKGKPDIHIGVMAHEIEKNYPQAVIEIDGFKHVHYGAL